MPIFKNDKTVALTHANGSSVEIYLYGATVTSWKAPSPKNGKVQERLYLSDSAVLDGSKAIRGGIPVVFPTFGPPPEDAVKFPYHSKLPQHGFARTSVWNVTDTPGDNTGDVKIVLELLPTPEITAIFPPLFSLLYSITLRENSLEAEMKISNPSPNEALQFQTLLHSYLHVPSHLDARVSPLTGLEFRDKVRGGATFKEDRQLVDVKSETDRVYLGAPSEITLAYGESKDAGGIEIKTEGFPQAVVWNPGPEKAEGMPDLASAATFVCVEPGHVADFYSLDAGKEWTGRMVLRTF